MERQRLINLDRITCIRVAKMESGAYLVFQDGRRNYAYKVKDVEYAQNALKTIERDNLKWWRILGEPVEVTFKKKEE